jgi:hypothetical protein
MLSLQVRRVFFFPDEKEPENQGCGCGCMNRLLTSNSRYFKYGAGAAKAAMTRRVSMRRSAEAG